MPDEREELINSLQRLRSTALLDMQQRDANERGHIATQLMQMAARQSVRTVFGWTHPDCVTLQEAARLLRGEPDPKIDARPIGVLSST